MSVDAHVWLGRVRAALMEADLPPDAVYLVDDTEAYFDTTRITRAEAWTASEVARVGYKPLCWTCFTTGNDNNMIRATRLWCQAQTRLLEDCGADRGRWPVITFDPCEGP